ncbi:EAL domain-containing protein [Vibrio hepatarius]|uniref:EAL domain-containing protein n=1 Tax=Vibrio hepatarius TaxID=171383 RepID=UPI0037362BBE
MNYIDASGRMIECESHHQKIVDSNYQVIGHEMLCRLKVGGVDVSVDSYLNSLIMEERTETEVELGFMHMEYFFTSKLEGICFINLSSDTVLHSVDSGRYEQIKERMSSNNIPLKRVCFEILESSSRNEGMLYGYLLSKLLPTTTRALDDFDYADEVARNRLDNIDFELVKVDKKYMLSNRYLELLYMHSLLVSKGKKIVFEGVESEKDFKFLSSLSNSYSQGYYIHRPSPVKM